MLSTTLTPALLTSNKVSLFLTDASEFDPGTLAMLQAFYSRSTMSIADRVRGMDSAAVAKSLERYYLGYGHRSIGQCGNFTMFFEDVSIFAAKAIENHPLFNGQETSTRYYDFSDRPWMLPIRNDEYESVMRNAYATVLDQARAFYINEALADGQELTADLERAAHARAFDLARCLLTAGHTTKVSWTTTFDTAEEHLRWMANSPSAELRNIASHMASMAHAKYPNAMPHPDTYVNSVDTGLSYAEFFDDTYGPVLVPYTHVSSALRTVMNYRETRELEQGSAIFEELRSRPRGTRVPRTLGKYGRVFSNFEIDYGSFRDIHRHRSGAMSFPHYPMEPKFHPWYIRELERVGAMSLRLPGSTYTVRSLLKALPTTILASLDSQLSSLHPRGSQAWHAARMYCLPMGFMVRAEVDWDLAQAIYVAELRSSRTVHPTARMFAYDLAEFLRDTLPQGFALHIDPAEDGIYETRGRQTIQERGNE